MKKIYLLFLVVLALLLPTNVFAHEEVFIEDEWFNTFEKQTSLTEERFSQVALPSDTLNEDFVAELETALLERKTNFTLTYTGNLENFKERMDNTIKQILLENEYLSYDYRGHSYSARGTSNQFTVNYTASYYQTKEQLNYIEQQVEEIVANIITPVMNDHEKVKAIHDYVVLNVEYDTTVNQGVNAPYFALVNGKTLCNGYAMLIYHMLQEVDIPVRLISGTAGENQIYHAWNLVQLDGEWYHLDATWNDPLPDEEGRVLYDYYLLSDEMIEIDHFWKTGGINGFEKPYPLAQANYADTLIELGYYELAEGIDLHYMFADLTASSDEEFIHLVKEKFNEQNEEFSIRFVANLEHIQDNVIELVSGATSGTFAKRWTTLYSRADYKRTLEEDYIVTIKNIEYRTEAPTPPENEEPSHSIEEIEVLMLQEGSIEVGQEIPLLVASVFENGLKRLITMDADYFIEDPEVIEISGESIIGKNPGSTEVIVSYDGHETSFEIQVDDEEKARSYPIPGYNSFGEQSNVIEDKTWTIELNQQVNSSIDDSQVYVMNQYGEKLTQQIDITDKNKVIVKAPLRGYKKGETYYLIIEDSLQSVTGKHLKEGVSYKFTIEN